MKLCALSSSRQSRHACGGRCLEERHARRADRWIVEVTVRFGFRVFYDFASGCAEACAALSAATIFARVRWSVIPPSTAGSSMNPNFL
jgi:hypothetical protein